MRFQIPRVTLSLYTALIGKHPSQLVKKGAFYTTEKIMPKYMLPVVFEPNVVRKKR
jgi:hypothetical protein